MIPALVALLILFIALFPVWFETRRRKRARERAREVLLELAPRLSIPGRLNGGTSLRFDRRGFPAAISIHAGARLNVEVSFRLQEAGAGWLTVSSLGFRRALLEQIGVKDLQVGDGEFDERFEVWGLDEGFVRKRLSREIRGLLLQTDRRWDFLLRLSPEQLSIRARVLPVERFQVETLAGIAYQILDLLGLSSPADFVLSTVQERLDDETRCPVCGTPLSRGSIVRCSKCRAAHHADCWQFNGLCATFACGGREKRAA
jgi:hypothetical protein